MNQCQCGTVQLWALRLLPSGQLQQQQFHRQEILNFVDVHPEEPVRGAFKEKRDNKKGPTIEKTMGFQWFSDSC